MAYRYANREQIELLPACIEAYVGPKRKELRSKPRLQVLAWKMLIIGVQSCLPRPVGAGVKQPGFVTR
jgi:hypothetical protein